MTSFTMPPWFSFRESIITANKTQVYLNCDVNKITAWAGTASGTEAESPRCHKLSLGIHGLDSFQDRLSNSSPYPFCGSSKVRQDVPSPRTARARPLSCITQGNIIAAHPQGLVLQTCWSGFPTMFLVLSCTHDVYIVKLITSPVIRA